MVKQYKQVFKDEVLKEMENNGLSVSQVAGKYKISPKTIYNWLDKKDPELREVLKENRQLKAELEVMVKLVKRLSVDLKKDLVKQIQQATNSYRLLKATCRSLNIHHSLAYQSVKPITSLRQQDIVEAVKAYQINHPTAGSRPMAKAFQINRSTSQKYRRLAKVSAVIKIRRAEI